jgi:hypothetical protein
MDNVVKHQELEKVKLTFHNETKILIVKIKPDVYFDIKDSIIMMGQVMEFVGGIKHKALIDMGKFTSSTQESRDLYKNSPYINAYRCADAFVVSSYATRFLVNVFITINKPNIPSKAFTEDDKAIEWLNSFSLE